MPFTPFHLGPGLLLGLLLLSYVDLPTFLLASVIVDVEPFLALYFNLRYPLHGLLHTFLGGALLAFILAALMSRLRKAFSPLMSFFRIKQKPLFKSILLASLFGVYFHIFLDSFLYQDIRPFYTFELNPLFSQDMFIGFAIYGLCILSFISGVAIYVIKLFFGGGPLKGDRFDLYT
jgi:membrane-bound metal-dependent hydrolase YbcI (DUF457 family)